MARSTEDGRDLSRMREEGQAIPADGRAGKERLGSRGSRRKQRRADLLARHRLAGSVGRGDRCRLQETEVVHSRFSDYFVIRKI